MIWYWFFFSLILRPKMSLLWFLLLEAPNSLKVSRLISGHPFPLQFCFICCWFWFLNQWWYPVTQHFICIKTTLFFKFSFIQSGISWVSESDWMSFFIRCCLMGACLFTVSVNSEYQASRTPSIFSEPSISSHGNNAKSLKKSFSAKCLNDLKWWIYVNYF